MSALKSSYGIQAARQLPLVIGSISMLSSVLQLLHTLIEGMWDCVNLPLVGLMTSPEEFTIGVGKGLSSLLRSTAVIFSTTGHFLSSLQACMLKLGFIDSDFHPQSMNLSYSRTSSSIIRQQHVLDMTNRRPPKGGIDGIRQGIRDLFVDPIIGFQKGGISGLFLGIVKGCLCLLGKPLYGILGNAASTMDTISFLLLPRIKGEEKLRLKRARPPRYFRTPNLPLQIYSADQNIGQELLSRVEMGFYHSEGYVWHTRLQDGTILIMTSIRLLLVGEKTYDFCELLWQCLISQILFLEIEYDRHLLLTSHPIAGKLSEDSNDVIVTATNTATTLTSSAIPSDKLKQLRPENDFYARMKNLKGSPILNLYHLPSGVTITNSTSSSFLMSKHTLGNNPGLQVTLRSLDMASHEQLIELMSRLLRPTNVSLVDDNVSTYLGDCGIHLKTHELVAFPSNRLTSSPLHAVSQQSSIDDLTSSSLPKTKIFKNSKFFVSP
jgi:hypothetical protein